MSTPTYEGLLDILAEHPEFGTEPNACDAEITAYGISLWKKWDAEEALEAQKLMGEAVPFEEKWNSPSITAKNKAVLRMIADGYSNAAIKERHELTASQLTQIKYRHGLTKKRGVQSDYSKYTLDFAKVKRDLVKYRSIAAVARKHGMPSETLRRYLIRNDIDYSKLINKSLPIITVATAAKKFKTLEKTANHFGLSPHRLKRTLEMQGTSWEAVKHAA